MAGAARRTDLADDRQHHVLGRHAITQRAIDAHFHRLGGREQQGLGGEHMLDLRRADAEGQRAQCAMRRGMAVATHQGRAGQGKALFRPDDMDDALRRRGRVDIVDAEFGGVAAKRLQLLRAFRIGDGQQAAIRVDTRRRGQIMVGHRQRQFWTTHLAPGRTKPLERLGAGHLMNEMAVDIDEAGAIGPPFDNVRGPDLLVQSLGSLGHDAALLSEKVRNAKALRNVISI